MNQVARKRQLQATSLIQEYKQLMQQSFANRPSVVAFVLHWMRASTYFSPRLVP